ncbi:MAG: helix-turn-helix domain-containing protein [Defluviitaleaceae bacterium]|nr:helix-turn-helix domain-containing protein [Defluviitaleaceae bacterium]
MKQSREELLESFFKLGGNYKNFKEAKSLEKKIKKHLKDIGGTDLQMLDVLKLLKAYEEYIKFNDFEKACEIVSSIIQRLSSLATSKWDLYDVRIVQAVIAWVETFEEAVQLARSAFIVLKKYKSHELAHKIELGIYLNLLERLVVADVKEIDAGIEPYRSIKVEEDFREFLASALSIFEEHEDKELKPYKILIQIREAVFFKDFEKADQYLEDLKDTNETAMYKAMRASVVLYSSINENFHMTEAQFKIWIGSNIREEREERGLTAKKLGIAIGITEAHMTAIERGERLANSYILAKIANELKTTTDALCKGIKVAKYDSKEEEALAKFISTTKGMGANWLTHFTNIAQDVKQEQELRLDIEKRRQRLRDRYETSEDKN